MYYFTGTGNSLAVARKVADKLGEYEVTRARFLKEYSISLCIIDKILI